MAFHDYGLPNNPQQRTAYRRKRQREVTNELVSELKKEMHKALKKCPEEFDGVDLRLLMARIVTERFVVKTTVRSKRSFNRACDTLNLV